MLPSQSALDLAALVEQASAALGRGDLATTEQICKRLVGAAPQEGRAWALLSQTALLRNRPDAALVCARRAVDLRPADPIGLVMLGKTWLETGEAGQAMKAARRAAKIQHLSAAAQDSIGALLGLLGRHDEALDRFRLAVEECRDVAQYQFNLAATERMLGRLEAAEARCDALIAGHPDYALAWFLRADLRTQSPRRNHVDALARILAKGVTDWRSEVTLRYALAKEYEDIARDAEAFAEVAQAARLKCRHQPVDARPDVAEIDRMIATRSRAWIANAPAGFGEVAPVFVVGLPRTGTTLVERIVASHSAVTSVGETGAFGAAVARARIAGAAAASPREIGEHYLATIAEVYAPRGRFVDKTLKNDRLCGLIHAALPNARILWVRRRPMDAGWAMYKAHFQAGFDFTYDLAALSEHIAAHRRLEQHWRAVLPARVFLTVEYEDVVSDQLGQSRRIVEFLDLPWEDGVLRFHESRAPSATASAVQVRQPVYASSIGKWRRHAEGLEPLRRALLRHFPEAEL